MPFRHMRDKAKRAGPTKSKPERKIGAEQARGAEIRPKTAAAGGKTGLGVKSPPFRRADSGIAVLYGIHPVREAVRAGRRKLLDLYATEEAAAKLADDTARAGLRARIVTA